MSEERKIEYSNGKIVVVWKPDLCAHAGECVSGSPSVFKPDQSPWVQIENSTSLSIMQTIDKCPSGALSYRAETFVPPVQDETPEETPDVFRIKASKNGPLLVAGKLELEDGDGNVTLCDTKMTALCRCGASRTKPFCDGSHKNVKFWG